MAERSKALYIGPYRSHIMFRVYVSAVRMAERSKALYIGPYRSHIMFRVYVSAVRMAERSKALYIGPLQKSHNVQGLCISCQDGRAV